MIAATSTALQAIEGSVWFLIIIMIWVLPWKGVALWKAAKLGHKWWFIAILILNTLALLEIAYILFVARPAEKKNSQEQQ